MSKQYGWKIVLSIAGIIGIFKYLVPFIQIATTKYGDLGGLAVFLIAIYLLFGKKY